MIAMDRTLRPGSLFAAVAVLLLMVCATLPNGRRSADAAEQSASARPASRGTDRPSGKSRLDRTRSPERGTRQQENRQKTDRRPVQKSPAGSMETQAAAARAFAAAHHPELIPLLDQLKQASPRQYQQAVGELSRASERFRRMRHAMPGRYESALAGWKLDSRIRLLAARMSADDSSDLENELRRLLQERLALRRQELQYEHERLTSRLEQVQQQLDRIEADPAAQVERDFLKVQRMLKRGSSSRKPARPAAAAVSTDTSDLPRSQPSMARGRASLRQPVVAPQPKSTDQ